MELAGSNYLYTLFTGSITYPGFATLIVIFRQTIGGGVSGYDVFVIRVVLMRSFIVAFSAMTPPAWARTVCYRSHSALVGRSRCLSGRP
jgi:hypothetical protein